MTGQSSPATVTATLCLQCVFKVAVSAHKCGVRSVFRFLRAKGETAAEIHRQLVCVYGEDVMNRQNVAKWCRELESGRSDVQDEIRSRGPSIVTDKIVKKTDENIRADRRVFGAIFQYTGIPHQKTHIRKKRHTKL
jgi:hypothetical protein